MPHPDLAVVTGAFSYTGKYVTRRLLDQGVHVRTLTRSPDAENLFAGQVETAPLDFSDPDGLRRSMLGAGVFYNTYWIRYAHGRTTFDLAVENTRTLFEAAKSAGVGRIVHFSVTNPSSESALPYFRGKAQVEDLIYEWRQARNWFLAAEECLGIALDWDMVADLAVRDESADAPAERRTARSRQLSKRSLAPSQQVEQDMVEAG